MLSLLIMSSLNAKAEAKVKAALREALFEKWVSWAALSSAILAVFAALTSVTSTSHGNAVTRDLIRNSNQWSYFQAKGIKANLLQTKLELLASSKRPVSDQDKGKLKEYRQEQEQSVEKAKEFDASIEYNLKVGGIFSRASTFLQISIGVVAVSLLTRRRLFWFTGLGIASFGVYFAIIGLMT